MPTDEQFQRQLGLSELLRNACNEGRTGHEKFELRFLDNYSDEELREAYISQFLTCHFSQRELSLIETILETRFIPVPTEEEIRTSL